MAACTTTIASFGFIRVSSSSSIRAYKCSVTLAPFAMTKSLKLSSCHTISGSRSIVPINFSTIVPRPQKFAVFAHKGYKLKTHKASAKRFRVTGRGKIVRRGAGKQHLLAKKNNKRKLRLSKMHPVSRSDYDNVIGSLPYLKVNRKAK